MEIQIRLSHNPGSKTRPDDTVNLVGIQRRYRLLEQLPAGLQEIKLLRVAALRRGPCPH